MKLLFRKLFTKDTDKAVDYIFEQEIKKPLQDTSRTAKKLKRLLEADGVTLPIYIALGGDHRK